jgi:hypothetical protein
MRAPTVCSRLCIAVFAACVALFGAGAAVVHADKARVEAVLSNIMELERPGQLALATIWDGNKYVQCRRVKGQPLRCESAGALMQPSLQRVLVPERVARLAALGWQLDPRFGNYARSFAADVQLRQLPDLILQTLKDGFHADLTTPDVESDWVKNEPCPPRRGWTQSLAGAIHDSPAMADVAVRGCAFTPPREPTAQNDAEPKPQATPPSRSNAGKAQLMDRYGGRVSGEIRRLRVNSEVRVYMVLSTAAGYVQCRPTPSGIYCEAQSADSRPSLARILTPDRVALLHAAGYADPGRSPNYWKNYAAGISDLTIATELLTILHDVYGYGGEPQLEFLSEKSRR